MQSIFRVTLCSALIAAAVTCAHAEERFDPAARAKAIAPFIGPQTIALMHVELARIDVDATLAGLRTLVPDMRLDQKAAGTFKQVRDAFLESGFRDVYAVASLDDVRERPPFLIVPVAAGSDVKKLARLLPSPSADAEQEKFTRLGDALFIGLNDGGPALARLKRMQPSPRPELAAALEAAGDTAIQVLLLPTATHRRVIDEMMPELPPEVGGGPTTILTHGLCWAAAGVDLPPDASLRLVVQSQDDTAAAAFRDKLVEGARALAKSALAPAAAQGVDKAIELLNPKVQGDRVTLALSQGQGDISQLLAALTRPSEEMLRRGWRKETFDHLKYIALAMHNWYDAHKSLPAVANFDADGKPLLSWRVHILPFLEQKKLYEEFHLDEPWDSPHNRTLIDRMPEVYRSPASKLTEKGRTNYVVPTGPQTVFPDKRGVTFKEVKDGMSNTIMIVEADDAHAVIWTKPEDLPWDPSHPAKGLGGLFEGGFNADFCDGSVSFLQLPNDPNNLRALFTRNGREPSPER